MTNPPPPGWQPPHTGPQNPFGQEQPQYGFPQTPPPAGWAPPQTLHKNKAPKFLLIGAAVLSVIALSVGATLLLTGNSGEIPKRVPNGSVSDIASAEDTGPVTVITEDPTCAPWRPIASTIAKQQKQGWADRDPAIPASSWSPEQQKMYQEAAAAMLTAADQAVPLAKMTPHRVMRELYEQSIAYWRAYANSIKSYEPSDNYLAQVSVNTASAIVSICGTIENQAAQARGPLVTEQPAPLPAELNDPTDPATFLNAPAPSVCSSWTQISNKFDIDTKAWREGDLTQEVSEWSPERRSVMTEAVSTISEYANSIELLGRQSANAVFADFASLAAQYWRAYVVAFSSYTSRDGYLAEVASYANFIIFNACASVSRS
ncbi:hypothetical protein QWI29_22630 [Mycolicibacterium neoaurum]|uniref:hypothetical protein n=1 Tax=Mycolicibacterium neoaurum TaxID=1795 RepID=UPI002673D5A0|nr:hypothetical protein [Mycolicibacterium neoaurum]MDO3402845.1 hypothetical protein [Mycolicibacterium neoaurum]